MLRPPLLAEMPESNHPKSLARRLRLIIWREHQPYIALLILACLMGMGSYYWHRSTMTHGMIDIDRAPPLQADFKVDVNAADWPELVVLPGVGEKLARAIVECRQENGPFLALEQIQQVPGIGAKKLRTVETFFATAAIILTGQLKSASAPGDLPGTADSDVCCWQRQRFLCSNRLSKCQISLAMKHRTPKMRDPARIHLPTAENLFDVQIDSTL